MSSPSLELNNIIVKAGAGAGKTTALVDLVLKIESEVQKKLNRHARLVVSTFTRKATQELKERLVSKATQENNIKALEFIQKPSLLHISTIHGVLNLYLVRFGSAIGLTSQFQLISATQEMTLAKKILRSCLSAEVSKIFEYREMNLLLSDLIFYFQIWCTNKSQRVSKLHLQQIIFERKKQLCNHLNDFLQQSENETLTNSWIEFITKLKSIYDLRDSNDFFERLYDFHENTRYPSQGKNSPSEEFAEQKKQLQKLIESFVIESNFPDYIESYENISNLFYKLAEDFCAKFYQHKIKNGFLSLQDLELFSYRLAKQYPATADAFSESWDYWLIDEFQDTSPIQVELIEMLKGERCEYLVGDPQQSIYLFRGARSEVFTEKQKQLPNQFKLENYRTRPELLSFINDIFSGMKSGQFQPMTSGYHKDLTQHEKEVAYLVFTKDIEQEVQYALLRSRELIEKGVQPEKICILCRSNDEINKLSLSAQQQDFAIQIHSGGKFAYRREVQDALALLKFILNPHDNKNLINLLRSPWAMISDNDLQLIPEQNNSSYFLSCIQLMKNHSDRWVNFQKLNTLYQLSQTMGYVQSWIFGLHELGVFNSIRKFDPSGRAEANLWKIVSHFKQQERKANFSPLAFIQDLSSTQIDGDGDQDATPVIEPKRVNIMTVHASKGLQFEYVILIGAGKKINYSKTEFFMASAESGHWTLSLQGSLSNKMVANIWGQNHLQQQKNRESLESERVLYVALTRSILGLTIISSNEYKDSWIEKIKHSLNIMSTEGLEKQIIRSSAFEYVLLNVQEIPLHVSEKKTSAIDQIRPPFQVRIESFDRKYSVTELLGSDFKTTNVNDILSHSLKTQIGIEMHQLFEKIKYNIDFDSADSQVKSAFDFIKGYEQGKILKIIKNGHVEWGFAIQTGKGLLQGQIDLWGEDSEGNVYVVDYKTGSIDYKDKALQQLEIYAAVLLKMKKIQGPVNLMIIYPFSKKVFVQKFTGKDLLD
jgi:ATP-dependent helicase/nuclease subunit A